MEGCVGEDADGFMVCPFEGCGMPVPTKEWDDHQLAHLLQLQGETEASGQQRQADTEFRQLQERYGYSMGGTSQEGFIAQTVRDLDRQVTHNKITPAEFHTRKQELLAAASTGLDDLSTCTRGIVSCLERYYLSAQRTRTVTSVSLSGETWHFGSARGDIGWGCGYRNMQMLLSCLLQLEPYKSHLEQLGVLGIPSIPKLQKMIEEAWHHGFDVKGCEDLQGKVLRTRKWIGTTEVASVLRNLDIRALVVDFAEPTGPDGTHPKLLQWVRDYFHGRVQPGGVRGSPSRPEDYPPLFFQHEGSLMIEGVWALKLREWSCLHQIDTMLDTIYAASASPIKSCHSRTITGLEERREDVILLVLDPLHSPQQMVAILEDPVHHMQQLRRSARQLKQKEYEIVFVDGIIRSEDEKRTSKVIRPFMRFPP